jgi:hypothetical protein
MNMTDIVNPMPPQTAQNTFNPAPAPAAHIPVAEPPVVQAGPAPIVVKPVDPKAPAKLSKDDAVKLHHDSIRQLAMDLRGASPSAAETISDKILAALDAIHDPEAWQKSQDVAKKAEDEREAERKVIREKMRPPAKVA